jgi:hypothetical protein
MEQYFDNPLWARVASAASREFYPQTVVDRVLSLD